MIGIGFIGRRGNKMSGLYAGVRVENTVARCPRCRQAVCNCYAFPHEGADDVIDEERGEDCKDGQ